MTDCGSDSSIFGRPVNADAVPDGNVHGLVHSNRAFVIGHAASDHRAVGRSSPVAIGIANNSTPSKPPTAYTTLVSVKGVSVKLTSEFSHA